MTNRVSFSRRIFLQGLGLSYLSAGTVFDWQKAMAAPSGQIGPTEPVAIKLRAANYDQVALTGGLAQAQLAHCLDTLLVISDDSMLKPFRERAGLPAPGADIGGWYDYYPGYDWQKGEERGFAPAHCFGQWLSALARIYASTQDKRAREKVSSLVKGYAQCISPAFFKDARFPGYTYDKLIIGLIDAHRYGGDPAAIAALEMTTKAVLPYLPEHVEDRDTPRPGLDASYTWDEPYTLPENLFIAYQNGYGDRYLGLAQRFLLDKTYFKPLALGQDALTGKHAYSYVNALGSAMQAYLTLGDEMYLKAATNAFNMIQKDHSYVTGGWGPDEHFVKPGTGGLGSSLETTHKSFEAPCGAYAHLKLVNYLTCVTADSRFGDSAEQIIYNTVLGAKPLQPDGRAFYYADYNRSGSKVYSSHCCPCCAGTLPQVASDYAKHAYFFADDGSAIFVNLYLNSSVGWRQGEHKAFLCQSGNYPQDSSVLLQLKLPAAATFAINLRIPGWANAGEVTVKINGQSAAVAAGLTSKQKAFDQPQIVAGEFLMLKRQWLDGDRIELNLPLPLRLVQVDDKNPDLLALVCGPRVLFAINQGDGVAIDKEKVEVTREQLLAAKKVDQLDQWSVTTCGGKQLSLLPYTGITDQNYTTYLKVNS